MPIYAGEDLGAFFPLVNSHEAFGPLLYDLSETPETVLIGDGESGWTAINLGFVPRGEMRVSILADGYKLPNGFGGFDPLPEVGYAVNLQYETYNNEFDYWQVENFSNRVQFLPDAILNNIYEAEYGFYQINISEDILLDAEHKLVVYISGTDIDLVPEFGDTLTPPITINEFFALRGYPSLEELSAVPDVDFDLILSLTEEYENTYTPSMSDGLQERLLITTGLPNGQRAATWGADWLELRTIEENNPTEPDYSAPPLSPEDYGELSTPEQQEEYIESQLLRPDEVAAQGWQQTAVGSGTVFTSAEYSEQTDGSFVASHGTLNTNQADETSVYTNLLSNVPKIALAAAGVVLGVSTGGIAGGLILAGVSAYSAYQFYEASLSAYEDLSSNLKTEMDNFGTGNENPEEFQDVQAERTAEYMRDASATQAWPIEFIPAVETRHSDISMKIWSYGAAQTGDSHSNRAILTMQDDIYDGMGGSDILMGQHGADSLSGGDGSDYLLGGEGNDVLFGGEGDDIVMGGLGDDEIWGDSGDDSLFGGQDSDVLYGKSGNDIIHLSGTNYHSAGYVAFNVSSETQIGTQARLTLDGLVQIEAVTDGGVGTDIVELSEEGDAFFLHDAYSGFHSSAALNEDYAGNESAARFANIEEIRGMGGNDIIDLTSPDYSLAGVAMSIDGGEGNDVIWGSDANESISGGNGNDTIFGGIGTDVLTGGAGADVFEFTRTSTDTSVTDFDAGEGDALRFYNAGGAEFDASSVALITDGIAISYTDTASGTDHNISIALATSAVEFTTTLIEIQNTLEII